MGRRSRIERAQDSWKGGCKRAEPFGRWDGFWLLGPGCCGSSAQSLYPGLCGHGQAPQPGGPQGCCPGGKMPLCGARVDQWLCSYRISLSMLPCWGSRSEVGMAAAQGLAQSFGLSIMVRPILIPSWALLCWVRRCHKGRGAGSSSEAVTWSVTVPSPGVCRVPGTGGVWFMQPL